MPGPFAGLKVLELGGIGPVPFAAMLLSDLGADVLRVERPGAPFAQDLHNEVLYRNRTAARIDLKHPEGRDLLLGLVERADVLLEGFRPGVAERLGLGVAACHARNPRLVYGRMTGWGQNGPLAHTTGHDINYIALAGALDPIGRAGEPPTPPLNLVGDFGGGGMLLVIGVLAALLERNRSGQGDVIDAAMVDGAALLAGMVYGRVAAGTWGARGTNDIDTGSHFYNVYETSDGEYVAVGAIEPKFYAELLARLGLDPTTLPEQHDAAAWPELKERFARLFRSRTRDEWRTLLEGTDACFSLVLNPREAPRHPHARARGAFVDVGGVIQPAPAPRFSRSATDPPRPGRDDDEAADEALRRWGVGERELDELRDASAIVARGR